MAGDLHLHPAKEERILCDHLLTICSGKMPAETPSGWILPKTLKRRTLGCGSWLRRFLANISLSIKEHIELF